MLKPLKSLSSTINNVKNNEGLRVDRLLTQLPLNLTRTQVQKLIANGKVFYLNPQKQWVVVKKPSEIFPESYSHRDQWRIDADESLRFVSRGGLKLQGALDHFQLLCTGKICWDVGLSTGGFSHCLLHNGALKVLGIDVGRGHCTRSLPMTPDSWLLTKSMPGSLCRKLCSSPFFQRARSMALSLLWSTSPLFLWKRLWKIL